MKARNHNYWIKSCITLDMSTEYQSMDSWLLLSCRNFNIKWGYVICFTLNTNQVISYESMICMCDMKKILLGEDMQNPKDYIIL
jgi:hypothetical protein